MDDDSLALVAVPSYGTLSHGALQRAYRRFYCPTGVLRCRILLGRSSRSSIDPTTSPPPIPTWRRARNFTKSRVHKYTQSNNSCAVGTCRQDPVQDQQYGSNNCEYLRRREAQDPQPLDGASAGEKDNQRPLHGARGCEEDKHRTGTEARRDNHPTPRLQK